MSETSTNPTKTNRENTAAAEAVKQEGRAASEALRQGGHTAAEAARRAGEAGAETLRRSTGAVADSHRQMAHEAAERFQEVSRTVAETAQGTAEDVRTLMALPTVADRGLQDLHHGMTGLIEGVVQTNLRATQELLRLSNPAGFVELQQRFVRDYMSALMEGSAAFMRAVRQTADQTLPPLEAHLRQRSGSMGKTGQYKDAAE